MSKFLHWLCHITRLDGHVGVTRNEHGGWWICKHCGRRLYPNLRGPTP